MKERKGRKEGRKKKRKKLRVMRVNVSNWLKQQGEESFEYEKKKSHDKLREEFEREGEREKER